MKTVDDLFKTCTKSATKPDGFAPYPYQFRLATRDEFPHVLNVPTGVGKTAAAILSWIYRRKFANQGIQEATPKRLIYCLPMRTLVEQTQEVAMHWLQNLGLADPDNGGIGLHLLMGGTDDGKWYEHPERDAILIGTQDMLLSRALNRGYGMSRYLWPMQYALLNNDCLWVMDETQLMGVGLTTSAQLAGLRSKLETFGACQTMWMSATLDADALVTVDHPRPESGDWTCESLDDDDRENESVQRLLNAAKPCTEAEVVLDGESSKSSLYEIALAEQILQAHRGGTLTLVVINRVSRAQDLYKQITKQLGNDEAAPELCLIHSRFRPCDRKDAQAIALNEDTILPEGRIVISTQAIEAGVDLSATTLFTELAPWTSLVQRFGRCNRRGICGERGSPAAQVHWIDIDTSNSREAAKLALPYEPSQLDQARTAIASLDDVGPNSLKEIVVDEPRPMVHVLRRKDLIDLFDTTPDLSGNDLDVSRYIRDSDDTDVQVYWRDWDRKESGSPPVPRKARNAVTFAAPQRDELCSVPVGQFRTFNDKVRKKDKALTWVWDALDAKWLPCSEREIRPGQTILMHVATGGYEPQLGWTGEPKHGPVAEIPLEDEPELPAAMPEEYLGGAPLTVVEHLKYVGQAAERLRDTLEITEPLPWEAITRAAWWHDVGKAHAAFQGGVHNANDRLDKVQLWAKSGTSGYFAYQIPVEDGKPTLRRGFRHELASALAWLQQHEGEDQADLIAYLIAAHHGKVRLSIRSMPNENKPAQNERGETPLFARGIWDGDAIPRIEIGNGDVSEEALLDLRLMQLGDYEDTDGATHSSWLSRMLSLREQYGPFKLAYLETLVRIADWRGSNRG